MTPNDFIESGVLELYVLDRLEPAVAREVEEMATRHPEVRAEIARIEEELENYALAHGVTPSSTVLTGVLERIRGDAPRPVDPVADVQRSGGPLAWAGMLLFALAALAAFYYYNQANHLESELETSREQLNELRASCAEIEEVSRAVNRRLQAIVRPDTREVILAATDNAPEARATVFYNANLQQAIFNAPNLPAPPTGKQYQLWAIDADGPRDLGVLATNLDGETLLDVEYVPDVAAFAVTLEEAGGKPTPDLTALQVIGNLE